MHAAYTTPLAKWARVLEIFIPGYMFGKAWGMGDEVTVDLFRATFPPFLIDMAEFFKGVLHTDNMEDFIKENDIDMAIITVPPSAAQAVADNLVEYGVNAILNFAPVAIQTDDNVRCLSVDLTTKLEALAYYMSYSKDKLWKIFS